MVLDVSELYALFSALPFGVFVLILNEGRSGSYGSDREYPPQRLGFWTLVPQASALF